MARLGLKRFGSPGRDSRGTPAAGPPVDDPELDDGDDVAGQWAEEPGGGGWAVGPVDRLEGSVTEELPAGGPVGEGPVGTDTDQLPVPVLVAGIHPEDPDENWIVPEKRASIRVGAITGILVLLGAVAGGFWGGVVAEKHHGSSPTGTSALASALRSLRSSGTGSGAGTSGRGGLFGAGGSATTGTVIGVQGDVIDISNSSGNIVKVSVPASATVTRTTKTTPTGVQIGDTVVVSGSSGPGGTVTATSVRAVARNASSGLSGGGSGFGPGGGAGFVSGGGGGG